MNIKYLFLLAMLSSLSFSCEKEKLPDFCTGGKYIKLHTTLIPKKTVYKLGDTIIFKIYSTDSLYDPNKKRYYVTNEVPFVANIRMMVIDDQNIYPYIGPNEVFVDKKFDPEVIESGSFGTSTINQFVRNENGKYFSEVKMVVKKVGTHVIGVNDINLQLGTYDDDYKGIMQIYKNLKWSDPICKKPFGLPEVFYDYDGDNNIERIPEKMARIEKNLLRGGLTQIYPYRYKRDVPNTGNYYKVKPVWEYHGWFSFDVVP